MAISIATAAPFYPLTLEDLKAHLHIELDDENEDQVLNDLIVDATDRVSVEANRQLITSTWDYIFGEVGHSRLLDIDTVKLPVSPFQSVVWVKYLDADEVQQTHTDYNIFEDNFGQGFIVFNSLPTTAGRQDDYQIRFTAGYGYSEDVPGPLRRAIKLLAADWYRNREATIDKAASLLPTGVEYLIAPYRIMEFK